eukprot:gene35001-45306_t
MMQTIPLSLPFYSRFSKDSLHQTFFKLKSSSVAIFGSKSISALPKKRTAGNVKDRIRKAFALVTGSTLLFAAGSSASFCADSDSSSNIAGNVISGDTNNVGLGGPAGNNDPVNDLIAQWFPQLQKLGFGGFLGICAAASFKKYGRMAAAYVGVVFVGFQALQQAGYITIDYAKVQNDTVKLLDADGDGKFTVNDVIFTWNRIKGHILYHVPGAGVSKLTSEETFGIFVLAAPEGSGKSTFTKMTMERLKTQHRSIYLKLILIGADLLLQKNLHECLKIPPRRPLSDFLPELTLIFIDQVDFLMDFNSSSLSEQLVLYLTGLAANSVNSKLFKIIICVSKPEVAHGILNCNGSEKFHLLCDLTSLTWSDTQRDDYVNIKMPTLPTQEKIRLNALAASCRNSPGLLKKASDLFDRSTSTISGSSKSNWVALKKYASKSEAAWAKFDETFPSIFDDEIDFL